MTPNAPRFHAVSTIGQLVREKIQEIRLSANFPPPTVEARLALRPRFPRFGQKFRYCPQAGRAETVAEAPHLGRQGHRKPIGLGAAPATANAIARTTKFYAATFAGYTSRDFPQDLMLVAPN